VEAHAREDGAELPLGDATGAIAVGQAEGLGVRVRVRVRVRVWVRVRVRVWVRVRVIRCRGTAHSRFSKPLR